MMQTSATLAYDDVSELVNRFGGLYVMLAVPDAELDEDGRPVPTPGGRGPVPNHHPRFYADDDTLVTGGPAARPCGPRPSGRAVGRGLTGVRSAAQPCGWVMFIIQGTPNRSVHMPNTSPHICFSRGTDTDASADSFSQ